MDSESPPRLEASASLSAATLRHGRRKYTCGVFVPCTLFENFRGVDFHLPRCSQVHCTKHERECLTEALSKANLTKGRHSHRQKECNERREHAGITALSS